MKKLFLQGLLCSTALFSSLLFSACEKENPGIEPLPDRTEKSEISYEINAPQGAGTTSSPINVSSEGMLQLEISQTSTYEDPNGQTITHEPKASIKISVSLDTVYAESLEDLKQIKSDDAIKTDKSGTFPINHKIDQTLEIGGQKICLDMAYDVFVITNSVDKSIEMPYIKLNTAKLGSAGAVEKVPEGRASVAVADITVRPLAISRAQTVIDSTMYEVNVRFNIGLESINNQNPESQTLEFLASYVGVVETTNTLTTPKAELSYVWDIKGGTSSTSSPFIQTKNENMELCLNQTSVYIDEYSNRYVSEPKATVRISALRDTVLVAKAENLTSLIEASADTSGINSGAQRFMAANKSIYIDWAYELATAPEGVVVDMPYYKLMPAKLKNITKRKLENTGYASDKNKDTYEITATFVQTMTAIGMPGDYAQSFYAEYVVSYIAAIDVKLVDVKYNRRYEWYDPHDNLALRSCYIIERELIYSNGETKKEEYRSDNYMYDVSLITSNPLSSFDYLEQNISNGEVLTFNQYFVSGDDPTEAFRGAKTGVPDLDKLSDCYIKEDGYTDTWGPKYYSTYKPFGSDVNFGSPEDKHVEGCYVKYVPYYYSTGVEYADYTGPRDHEIREYGIHQGFQDRFFYFADTDTIIDFKDWYPTRKFKVSVEETQIPEGRAKLYKIECNAHYLGKDFYSAVVDTIYQNK